MPTFNFQVIKTLSKKREKTSKTDNSHKVIQKKIVGIVHIDISGRYYVVANNTKYCIALECFSCRNIRKLYRQGEYDYAKVVYIRTTDTECNMYHWLPFTVGCVVTGDVVEINKSQQFVINKVDDVYNDDTHAAIEFYRKHIKEINDAIRQYRER